MKGTILQRQGDDGEWQTIAELGEITIPKDLLFSEEHVEDVYLAGLRKLEPLSFELKFEPERLPRRRHRKGHVASPMRDICLRCGVSMRDVVQRPDLLERCPFYRVKAKFEFHPHSEPMLAKEFERLYKRGLVISGVRCRRSKNGKHLIGEPRPTIVNAGTYRGEN